MAPTPFVRARTEELNTDDEAILANLALPLSDALRLALTLAARDKAPPLELKTPDAAALAAIAATHAKMAARMAATLAGDTAAAPEPKASGKP